MKKFWGAIKKHKFVTAIAVIAAVVLFITLFAPKNPTAGYVQETVEKRDIATYNSFVGNVGFTTEMNALSKASAEITEVLLDIGDSVSKGDVIARLDSETLEDNIEKTELALKTQQTANSHTIADAQRAYDDFKYTLDNGLNANLNNVQTQRDNAKKALDKLEEALEDYLDNLEDAVSAGAASGASVLIADRNAYEKAEKEYDDFKVTYEAMANDPDADPKILESYGKVLEDYKASMERARVAYETSLDNYCDNQDSTLKTIVNNVEDATTAYNAACSAYDSVKLQLDQQLIALESTLNKAKDTLSLESAEKDLQMLKDTLKNYQIVAPCDGIITALNIDEGNMAVAGSVAATVSNLGELDITIKIDEYSILNTEVGKKVVVYIDSIKRTYEGTITWIANNATIAQGVSYFEATVEFTADEYVRGGMSVEVRLTSSESLGAISVSVDAVNYRENNTAYVYVSDGVGGLVERDVSLGNSDGLYVEITDGISEGDSVFYIPGFEFPFPMMGR